MVDERRKGDGQFYVEHFAPDRVWNLMQVL